MKRVIVCFDGTWNDADDGDGETNVARIAQAIHGTNTRSGTQQIVLYLKGVGTAGSLIARAYSGATGLGIEDTIQAGYRFLAQNYQPGDEIYLFGFSRGAYAARSCAGMMSACGLLKRQSLGHLNAAWTYYREADPRRPAEFVAQTGAQSHLDVEIRCLGVWDTVGRLGVPLGPLPFATASRYSFHDTTPSRIVRNGFHALAIDEHRDEFVPTLWTGEAPEACTIEQVWFPGAHADIGGGYRSAGLSDIALHWMAGRARAVGLELDPVMLPADDDLQPLAPQHDPRKGLFLPDQWTPTLRVIGGQVRFKTSMLERVYQPLADDGTPLPTINEQVHPSAVARLGKPVQVLMGDTEEVHREVVYEPKALASMIGPRRKPRAPLVLAIA
jgi:uncharacterized protein (DUF2235 family)